MSRNLSSGRMTFDFALGKPVPGARPEDETPFRILLMGDFGGQAHRGAGSAADPKTRSPVAIDVDNLDAVIEKLGIEIHLPIGDAAGHELVIPIRKIEDLHPDRIFTNTPIFGMLKQIRQLLSNPATFEVAAAQVRAMAGSTPEPAKPAAAPASAQAESDTDLMQRLLGQGPTSDAPSRAGSGGVDISGILADAVRDHIVPHPHPQQAEYIGLITDAMAAQMRAILHHRTFQRIEAAWRGVQFLVSRVETGEELKLYLMDISKVELAADLERDDLAASAIYKRLVERGAGTQGGDPWAMLVGNYAFGPGQEDVSLLARLGAIAQRAGAPFVAGASPELMGCPSIAAAPDPDHWKMPVDRSLWDQLRAAPAAEYIGLAWPRFLLRLPYGQETDEIDSFPFEEISDRFTHEQYLWGNAGFACACVVAEAFVENGWDLRPGGFMELTELPMHSFKRDGEMQVQAAAEGYLSDRAAQLIQGQGIIPLLSVRGRNSARFAGFQSIADPPRPLAGRWG